MFKTLFLWMKTLLQTNIFLISRPYIEIAFLYWYIWCFLISVSPSVIIFRSVLCTKFKNLFIFYNFQLFSVNSAFQNKFRASLLLIPLIIQKKSTLLMFKIVVSLRFVAYIIYTSWKLFETSSQNPSSNKNTDSDKYHTLLMHLFYWYQFLLKHQFYRNILCLYYLCEHFSKNIL